MSEWVSEWVRKVCLRGAKCHDHLVRLGLIGIFRKLLFSFFILFYTVHRKRPLKATERLEWDKRIDTKEQLSLICGKRRAKGIGTQTHTQQPSDSLPHFSSYAFYRTKSFRPELTPGRKYRLGAVHAWRRDILCNSSSLLCVGNRGLYLFFFLLIARKSDKTSFLFVFTLDKPLFIGNCIL